MYALFVSSFRKGSLVLQRLERHGYEAMEREAPRMQLS